MPSHLLQLPAELRLKILEYLFIRPDLSSSIHQINSTAFSRGFTDGVGHVTLAQQGSYWKSLSVARPPALSLTTPSILRICRLLHREATELLYGRTLFVINILNMSPIAPPFMLSTKIRPIVVASPSKKSVFMQSLYHIHVRQHIRPEEDLLRKAQVLHSLLSCLSPHRKSTSVTLHFDGILLVNDCDWPYSARGDDVWEMYARELRGMEVGGDTQIRVSQYWRDLEGSERFEKLATRIGGSVNTSDNYVYW
ncbi:hypothetical protein DOTSEDRAFT_23940 [Dothistroma septosporum NZE10]|uniref:F-box domain-containing protein n=1 Tax=Dothistroma septosporum (strain NZE10 / CBS 128990) TaxID=675120 RepID=N1PN50_DOTSN|nr:hypothetical protein DOTSEDRAFT_23940 [Dothistroma septosporum NZE10]